MVKRFAGVLSLALAAAFAACADAPTAPDLGAPVALASVGKVDVCHVNGRGRYNLISVGTPALAAHLAHGDAQPGDAAPGGGVFGADCAVLVYTLDYSTTVTTGLGGGGGGGPFDDSCPTGSVGVGLSGDQVDYFGWAALFRHSLECRELLPNGTLGASSSTPDRGLLFNIPPQNPYTGICAGDRVLVGASGWQAWLVNSIQGDCATVATVVAAGAPDAGIGPFTGTGFAGFWSIYSAACPAGYAVTGTIGSAGDILDSVGFRCTRIVLASS